MENFSRKVNRDLNGARKQGMMIAHGKNVPNKGDKCKGLEPRQCMVYFRNNKKVNGWSSVNERENNRT